MAAFDNPTNTTQLAGIMQTTIAERLIPYYNKQRVFRGLLDPADIIRVPNGVKTYTLGQSDTLSFDLATEGTEDTPEAYSTTATDAMSLTPVVHQAQVLVDWQAANDTPVDVMDNLATAAGTAWAVLEDSNDTYGFHSLYTHASNTSPDHEIGADGTALDAARILEGSQLLMTAGAFEPYNHVIDPIQVKELFGDSEAKQWLRQSDGAYAATVGVNPNRYLGQIYGVHIWRADAMYESSGLFSMMFGLHAMGLGYKLISNPLNPTPLEFSPTVQWEDSANSYRITYRVCMQVNGISDTATTNRFMVAIVT